MASSCPSSSRSTASAATRRLSATDVQFLVGCDVFFPQALTPEPDEEKEYTWRYFTGFTLFDNKAGLIGQIDAVDESTRNVLFRVGKHLIPAADEWVTDINHKERTIRMDLPEGLLDL